MYGIYCRERKCVFSRLEKLSRWAWSLGASTPAPPMFWHVPLCSHSHTHTPVSLPGDNSALEEVVEEELVVVVVVVEGPNPTILSSNSRSSISIISISRYHNISSSSNRRPIKRTSSSPSSSQKASTPSTDTEGGATRSGSRAAGITTVTARTDAGTSSRDSLARGTPKTRTT